MKVRSIALAWLIGICGLSLVGAGVYAVGSSAPVQWSTNQGLSVVLSANGARGNGTANITLESFGPAGSSFMTPSTSIKITNNGTLTTSGVALQLSARGVKLEKETWVCLVGDGRIVVNESLTKVQDYGEVAIQGLTLVPGATASYVVVYYAGTTENTGCGGAFTGYSATPSNGYPGQYSTTEAYPSGTTNPGALSLTQDAQGGTLVPTVTISYVGVAGTLRQTTPFGQITTVSNTGTVFNDQLHVSGSRSPVTYVVTTANPNLHVTSSGLVTTVAGPLAVGAYFVAGTDSDTLGDVGTWSYTLTVAERTITCTGGHTVSVNRSQWIRFNVQLSTIGAQGESTFNATSSADHLRVSNDGEITTDGGPPPPGTYTISGHCRDSYGDSGTWSYTLTVVNG